MLPPTTTLRLTSPIYCQPKPPKSPGASAACAETDMTYLKPDRTSHSFRLARDAENPAADHKIGARPHEPYGALVRAQSSRPVGFSTYAPGYTLSLASLSFLSLFAFLRSRPFSLQGKWTTGIMKNELLGSAMPAIMLYQAMNAAAIPNPPPSRVSVGSGTPSLLAASSKQPSDLNMTSTNIHTCVKVGHSVSMFDPKPARRQDDTQRYPKPAIPIRSNLALHLNYFRRTIAQDNLPHARQQLHKAAICVGRRHHHTALPSQVPSIQIDHTQEERSQSETTESQGDRVTELKRRRLIETWLQAAGEGGKTQRLRAIGVVAVDVGEWVTAIIGIPVRMLRDVFAMRSRCFILTNCRMEVERLARGGKGVTVGRASATHRQEVQAQRKRLQAPKDESIINRSKAGLCGVTPHILTLGSSSAAAVTTYANNPNMAMRWDGVWVAEHKSYIALFSSFQKALTRGIRGRVKLGIFPSEDLRTSLESLQIKIGVEAIARIVLLEVLVEVQEVSAEAVGEVKLDAVDHRACDRREGVAVG
ncbi:hypothetical protein KC340_g91 [Hortaea werneckii]|nr:hypothetical protein KC340_g91 [Hortaea werneckii]